MSRLDDLARHVAQAAATARTPSVLRATST